MSTIVLRQTKGSPLIATEVDANFTNLNTDKAEINSPTFTGIPLAPTAPTGTNTTQLATTAFVKGQNYITGVTGTAPIVSSGGAAPALSMAVATTSVSGYLTSTDWTTFNNKQNALGFTPYNATNPSNYLAYENTISTSINSTNTVNLSGGLVAATDIAYSGTLTGSTGVIAIGINQIYKDAAGNVGVGTSSPSSRLAVSGNITIAGAFSLKGSYGAGAITSNFAAGDGALESNTTGNNNTASGVNALKGNTTGNNNTASGVNALLGNTTGSSNTAIGLSALLENTTGYDNTAVGNNALRSNSDTYHNVAIGSSALMTSVSDLFNTAIGTASLKFHNGGNRNTGCGYATLFNHLTGDRNTAIGCDALYTGTSGNDNTAVGNNALYTNLSGSSNTAVGAFANALATGSKNTSIGYEAGCAITWGANNVVIGGYTGSAPPISFTGSNNIVISDGAANIRAYYTSTTSLWTIPNDMAIAGKFYKSQPSPSILTGSNTVPITLTIANLLTYIIIATPITGTTVYNLPTGTLSDTGTSMDTNYCFDWSIMNNGAVSITLTAAVGHTIVAVGGGQTLTTGLVGNYRTRKTAANTFVTYRI